MKKTLCMLLALCLIGSGALPAVSEEVLSAAVEAPVAEARSAGGDNGLWIDSDALPEDEGSFGVSAASEEGEPVAVNPYGDEFAYEEPELELTGITAEELPAPVAAEPDETPVLLEDVTEAVGYTPVEGLPDSEELFAGYARRILYNRGKRMLMAANNAGRKLTGNCRMIYDVLKEAIVDIAAGNRTSTVVTIPVADLLGKTRFSASELGVTIEFDDKGNPTTDSLKAFTAAYIARYPDENVIGPAMDALWCDCAYELYWHDRYITYFTYSRPTTYLRKYDSSLGDYVIYLEAPTTSTDFTISLPVLEDYAGDGAFTFDTEKIGRARTAAQNARAIVDEYANCSDYAKLYGYVCEICALTDYNHNLPIQRDADGQPILDEDENEQLDVTNQDPWKLIWVFDGDASTKVVCEGYTLAFSYLCELSSFDSNIRCLQVGGTAGEPHAWNLVRMDDGNNYVVDVTWTDTASLGNNMFLIGGSGSVNGSYTLKYRNGNTSTRSYDADTLACYSVSDLQLSDSAYVLNGFVRDHGAVYYYVNGDYLTGTQEIDGKTYVFDNNGVLGEAYDSGLCTHTPVVDEAVAATCTTAGKTEGTHCSKCGAVLAEQYDIPALGHRWSVSYTLSEDGATMTARRVCLRDPSHAEQETANTVITSSDAATCSRKGVVSYKAEFTNSAFGTRTLSRVTAVLPHTPGATVVENEVDPTCEADGSYDEVVYCTVCKAEIRRTTSTVAALGHDLVHHEAKAATCTEAGWNAYDTCSRCDYTTYEEIEALGHDPVHHDAKAATCTEIGWEAYDTCSRCDYTTYEEIAALGHDLVNHEAKAATCTEIGWNAYDTCSRCDYTTYEELAALGHDPVHHDAKEATCTEKGWKAYDTCARCDYTTYAEIPAKGHNPKAHGRVDASYTATGTEAYWECTECHHLFSDSNCKTEIQKPVVIPMKTLSAANDTIAIINALPATADASDKAAVAAALAAFNALSDDEKQLISDDTRKKLESAKAQVEAAEKAAAEKASAEKASAEKAAAEKAAAEKAAAEKAAAEKAAAEKAAAEKAAAEKAAAEKAAAEKAAAEKAAAEKAAAEKAAAEKAAAEKAAAEKAAAEKAAAEKAAAEKAAAEKAAAEKAAAEKAAAEKAAAEKAAADSVIASINALPSAAGTSDKSAVEAARAAYNALTDAQKKLVSADVLARLTSAESQIAAAEKEAARINLSKAKVTVKAQVYTGKAIKPAVTVKLNGKALKKGTDYTVSYKNNKAVGKATVTVTGKGKYAGAVTKAFKINPKKVTGLTLKAGEKALAVSWKKRAGVTGYQVQYSLKKTFSGAKTVTIKKVNTVKTTLKKLKAKTTYYVRIRSYKIVKGARYYSAWTAAKVKKTK